MSAISKTSAWQQLVEHQTAMAAHPLNTLFAEDPQRFEHFSLEAAGLLLDYSKNHLNAKTKALLVNLAHTAKLSEHIDQLYQGHPVNCTEGRAALHIALRRLSQPRPIAIEGEDVVAAINANLKHIHDTVTALQSGQWQGFSGKAITDIVNIGIGGSDLGSRMATLALAPFATSQLKTHFVANIDATDMLNTLAALNPETTVFIIASKSFTTQETLYNARLARDWLQGRCQDPQALSKHFIAVTNKPQAAAEFGVAQTHIFPLWDWIGGRYSLWSAIGLPLALAIGMTHFKDFLAGARAMDEHFFTAPLAQNMPVIMGLIGVWYRNFYHTSNIAIVPYDHSLSLLPVYLQQLDMESNGKNIDRQGEATQHKTGPVLWGGAGSIGQHSFHQLLHQGTHLIPVDFIVPASCHHPVTENHHLLLANCLAQSQALMQGKTKQDAYQALLDAGASEQDAQQLSAHKVIPGNRPSNTIILPKLTPFSLGALLALYEHKVFVQSVIWNINAFDQWGVELGKQLALDILPNLAADIDIRNADSSTVGLINHIKQHQKILQTAHQEQS